MFPKQTLWGRFPASLRLYLPTHAFWLISSNTSRARISPVPKSAEGRLRFPKSAMHMQAMGLLSLVPAGRGIRWASWQPRLECRQPPNTPSLAFCSPGDWCQIPPASEQSDAISIWQGWVAPDELCWRYSLIFNCCNSEREGFWSCSNGIFWLQQQNCTEHHCCLMLMLTFSSLSQQKVFSSNVLWFLALENKQLLQKHRSDPWLTFNQDDTGIFYCTGSNLGPVLQTDT